MHKFLMTSLDLKDVIIVEEQRAFSPSYKYLPPFHKYLLRQKQDSIVHHFSVIKIKILPSVCVRLDAFQYSLQFIRC